MRMGLGQAALAAEKGPRVRPRKSGQSIIQVGQGGGGSWGNNDLVWDMLDVTSVGHLRRSPKQLESEPKAQERGWGKGREWGDQSSPHWSGGCTGSLDPQDLHLAGWPGGGG